MKTRQDVETWVKQLMAEKKIMLDVYLPFNEYVDEGGNRVFTDEECDRLETEFNQAHTILQAEGRNLRKLIKATFNKPLL
ncbi:hypothetical protein [Limnovirga soli]|uniref:Uncharacterized protein n=1 Tax=Limnovirga soli TaxID=2656915 RepID=A0A8J8JVZ9_9BACT|nr:hypothetical protein [Limnovirga soli]NNV57199.1 hypothetical protein [Limnovirga soli]